MMASVTEERRIVHSSTSAGRDSSSPREPGQARPARPRTGGIWAGVAARPRIVAALGTLPVGLWVVAHDGGYNTTTWYAAGIWLALLLAVLLLTLPAPRRPPAPVLAALGCLGAYTAWSYASIGWAEEKAAALQGANRTALYFVVLALLSLWPLRARAAAWAVGLLAVGIAAVGAVELLRASADATPLAWFLDARFYRPVGYSNGNAALWSAAFWPCAVLASRRQVTPPLRAVLVGAAVVVGGLALLSQSRGWLFSLPVVTIVYLVLARERLRALLWLAIPAVATAATAPRAFDVYDAVQANRGAAAALDRSAAAIFVAAAVAALVTLVAAAADDRIAMPRRGTARARGPPRLAGPLVAAPAVRRAPSRGGH